MANKTKQNVEYMLDEACDGLTEKIKELEDLREEREEAIDELNEAQDVLDGAQHELDKIDEDIIALLNPPSKKSKKKAKR